MNRFEQVDLIAALGTIMETNTRHYQADFETDKDIFREAAGSLGGEPKSFLWFSRPSGTFCGTVQNVFTTDTYSHNAFCYYAEQTRDKVLAYGVEITGTDQGRIMGNLYQLDYPAYAAHVRAASVPEDQGEQLAARLRAERASFRQLRPASLNLHLKKLQREAARQPIAQQLKAAKPAARKPATKKEKGGMER